ncbi:MAG TPA: hypothetical protein VFH05_04020, partial [Nitrospira sp.]|nr:hypothetical protein [Nitrospira sp.]
LLGPEMVGLMLPVLTWDGLFCMTKASSVLKVGTFKVDKNCHADKLMHVYEEAAPPPFTSLRAVIPCDDRVCT